MTGPPVLAHGYEPDRAWAYAEDLLTAAYPGRPAEEHQHAIDTVWLDPQAVRAIQARVADDPDADIPDWMRTALRDHANRAA